MIGIPVAVVGICLLGIPFGIVYAVIKMKCESSARTASPATETTPAWTSSAPTQPEEEEQEIQTEQQEAPPPYPAKGYPTYSPPDSEVNHCM